MAKITDVAIDKVRRIELQGYTPQEMELLKEQHKELLRISRDINNSNEVSQMFNNSFKNVVTVLGTETGVSLNNSIDARTTIKSKGKKYYNNT